MSGGLYAMAPTIESSFTATTSRPTPPDRSRH
ncbi:hypothetical protein ACETU7_30075 [Rhodococcus sp. 3Y1]